MRKLLALFLLGMIAIACTKPIPRFVVRPVYTDDIFKARLEFLDSRHGPDALCADYRLLQYLIYYIQNDPIGSRELEKGPCPENYAEFVKMVQTAQMGLRDLHTQVAFGNGLDAIKKPVVTACSGHDLCEKTIGSAYFSVPTSVRDEFYGVIFSTTTEAIPMIIESVDGKPMQLYKDQMDKDSKFLYSHSKEAWSQYLPNYVFERVVAADRPLNPLTVRARTLDDKQIKFTLAYDQSQSIFPAPEYSELIGQMDVGRSYGCKEVLDPSDYDIGACITQAGKIVIWLYTWPDVETIKEYGPYLAQWIESKIGKEKQVFFDMRGNGGGSPLAVAQFICLFGDDNTLKIFDSLSLRIRSWPATVKIGNTTIDIEKDLKATDNLSIRQFAPSLNVGDGIDAMPQETQLSFSQRTMLTKESCKELRVKDAEKWKWQVFTNGNEFSSAENFLFFAALSKDKFQVHGRNTVGGTGNPTWIALPRTNTGLRLSSARDYINGQAVIEKVGVEPDFKLEVLESAEEFRKRFTEAMKTKKAYDWGSDFRPQTMRDVMAK